MKDINKEFERRQKCWNKRFVACWKGKYTQAELASALNKKYKTDKFKQASINRWMHLGETKRKTWIKGFPTYDTMFMIANFFGVDVGYLTGETDAETYSEDYAQNYLDLSTKAIKVMKEAIGNKKTISSLFTLTETAQEIINNLITADNFLPFMRTLVDMDRVCTAPDTVKPLWEEAERRFGADVMKEAFIHRDDDPRMGDPELDPPIPEAIQEVNRLLDEEYGQANSNELFYEANRYKLQLAFNKLIDELYPPQNFYTE